MMYRCKHLVERGRLRGCVQDPRKHHPLDTRSSLRASRHPQGTRVLQLAAASSIAREQQPHPDDTAGGRRPVSCIHSLLRRSMAAAREPSDSASCMHASRAVSLYEPTAPTHWQAHPFSETTD